MVDGNHRKILDDGKKMLGDQMLTSKVEDMFVLRYEKPRARIRPSCSVHVELEQCCDLELGMEGWAMLVSILI